MEDFIFVVICLTLVLVFAIILPKTVQSSRRDDEVLEQLKKFWRREK